MLSRQNINASLYTFPTVKPIDVEAIKECASQCRLIVTVEEHNIIGGSAVAEVLSEIEGKAKLIRIGLNDKYSSIVGTQKYLRAQYGMDAQSIYNRILSEI